MGSKGSQNRIRIVSKLRDVPLNKYQLSQELGLDYKLVNHHLEILQKNNVITSIGKIYGATYFVSELFLKNELVFDELVEKVKFQEMNK